MKIVLHHTTTTEIPEHVRSLAEQIAHAEWDMQYEAQLCSIEQLQAFGWTPAMTTRDATNEEVHLFLSQTRERGNCSPRHKKERKRT